GILFTRLGGVAQGLEPARDAFELTPGRRWKRREERRLADDLTLSRDGDLERLLHLRADVPPHRRDEQEMRRSCAVLASQTRSDLVRVEHHLRTLRRQRECRARFAVRARE